MEALVAITYRCNAKCYMCNTWKYPTTRDEEITVQDIKRLPNGLGFANITGGEPFLREDIEEIVAILRRKADRIVVSTNGYLSERIINAAKNNPDIGFRVSLEGLPRANDELRGIKNGFDHGLRTLLQLHDLGVKDIGFGITISDRNAQDLMALYSLAKAMGVEFATAAVHNTYYFHKFDNCFEDPDSISEEFRKLIREMLKSRRVKDWFRAYLNHGLVNYIQGQPRLLPCGAAKDVFFVDPFGEVRPCNAMEVSMGNLKTNTFDEIWNGPQAVEVRRKVEQCDSNCWMVGTVAPAMKRQIWAPAKWILKNKWSY